MAQGITLDDLTIDPRTGQIARQSGGGDSQRSRPDDSALQGAQEIEYEQHWVVAGPQHQYRDQSQSCSRPIRSDRGASSDQPGAEAVRAGLRQRQNQNDEQRVGVSEGRDS